MRSSVSTDTLSEQETLTADPEDERARALEAENARLRMEVSGGCRTFQARLPCNRQLVPKYLHAKRYCGLTFVQGRSVGVSR